MERTLQGGVYTRGMILRTSPPVRDRADLAWLAAIMGISVLLSLLVARAFPPTPLFELGNLVGPTAKSLLHGGGLAVCTEVMGTPGNAICYHAGRMPLASLVVAAGIELLGNQPTRVEVFKTLLLLLPLEGAIWLAWMGCGGSAWRRVMVAVLLLAPFGVTAFLADVVNLQVEEGYSYSLLALAVAILLFGFRTGVGGWLRALAFAVATDGVYLTKSSMAPAVAVLVVSYVCLERRTAMRLAVLGLVLLAPVGWALHQHHASGRYSVGTSIDGINLHKSNNRDFLRYYPPAPGATLDEHDAELNRGLHFNDEWSFNDYHARAAVEYAKGHPGATLTGVGRKLWVVFFSVRKFGSGKTHGAVHAVETAGFVLFRLILWAAMVGAGYFVGRDGLGAGVIFLGLVAAVALPYVVGFAYTRHVSVLIYPAVLMCCWMVERGGCAGGAAG